MDVIKIRYNTNNSANHWKLITIKGELNFGPRMRFKKYIYDDYKQTIICM